MKPATFLNSAVFLVMKAGTGCASIGQGIDIFDKLFTGGFIQLINEVTDRSSKRSTPVDVRQVPGVPQEEYDRCKDSADGATITASSPAGDTIQFSGVPAYCMNLANVLVGDDPGPYALPCGSDCLEYSGLTEGEFNQIADALSAAA